MAGQLHQWAVTCRCGVSVEFYCKPCDHLLCQACKEIHGQLNPAVNHAIVAYSERTSASKHRCKEHPSNDLVLWCESCCFLVCLSCITSNVHRNHVLGNLEVKLPQKRKCLQEGYEKTKECITLWQMKLSELDDKEKITEKFYEDIESEIKEQSEDLCKKVREVESKRLERVQAIKIENSQKVHRQRRTLKCNIDKFEEDCKDYETILRCNDAVSVLEFDDTIVQQGITLPPELQQSEFPLFKAGEIDISHLEMMFGNLASNEKVKQGNWKSARDTRKQGYTRLLSRPRSNSLPSSHAKAYVIDTAWKNSSLLICIRPGTAWMATSKTDLSQVDKEGNILKKISFNFAFCDAVFTLRNDVIFLDDQDNCVRLWSKEGTVSVICHLDLKPYGMCQLQNGQMILTFRQARRMIKYDESGKQIMEFEKLSLNRPWFVVQNRVNKRIYLTDKSGYGHYKDSGRVVSSTENGEFCFEYTGPIEADFAPVDLCSNMIGQILITDYVNHSVHILNQDGRLSQFLKIDGPSIINPCRIDIDGSGFVWISEHESKKVKVVRFT